MEKGAPPYTHAPPPPGFAPPPGYGPPPPPPSYNDGQPNVIIMGSPQFGSESQRFTCPQCNKVVSTTVETESNTKTHLFAVLLCVLGLWCCAPCPYCIDSCLVKKHYCPSCKAYLGQSEN